MDTICEISELHRHECHDCISDSHGAKGHHELNEEEVVMRPSRTQTGKVFFWRDAGSMFSNIREVPSDTGFLHISGSFKMKDIRRLITKLQNFYMLSVNPSQGKKCREQLVELLSPYGIGLMFARRFQKPQLAHVFDEALANQEATSHIEREEAGMVEQDPDTIELQVSKKQFAGVIELMDTSEIAMILEALPTETLRSVRNAVIDILDSR